LAARIRRRPDPDDHRAVDRAISKAADAPVTGKATAGGDERALRGIPCIGRGVGGAIRGTQPGVRRP
jgi:hypothetical protein